MVLIAFSRWRRNLAAVRRPGKAKMRTRHRKRIFVPRETTLDCEMLHRSPRARRFNPEQVR
ncbi:hypothetical protein [Roseomonas fluvialis]|uniref:hypothetical protein n=1 Tax=Roseomonas fluvialis TaxID=1750527 RepID=UPI001FCB6797|nr:hypothetical protein [Roseomonas fluvialis]